jgi:hypothetical protein
MLEQEMLTDSTTIKNDFLESIGCSKQKHSGRTLMEHLIGVHDILREWDAPEYLQDAGLFHSVYGTTYFKPQMTVDRDKVRNLIGEHAEEISFLFCTIPHPRTTNIDNLEDDQLRIDLLILNKANQDEQANAKLKFRTIHDFKGVDGISIKMNRGL